MTMACNLQEAKAIVPKLLDCLNALPNCSTPSRSLTGLQASLALLFSSLHRVICIDQLAEAARHDISQACKDLLAASVTGETQSMHVNSEVLKALRGALQLPCDSSHSLPVTPQHSAELLGWLVQKQVLVTQDSPVSSSQANLLLAARLYKVAAHDSKLIDVHVAQHLASIACRLVSVC